MWVGNLNQKKEVLRAPSACDEEVSSSRVFHPQLLWSSGKLRDAGKEGAHSATVPRKTKRFQTKFCRAMKLKRM